MKEQYIKSSQKKKKYSKNYQKVVIFAAGFITGLVVGIWI